MKECDLIISHEDPILITGANGFVGSKVVQTLLAQGFNNLRCFVRPSGDLSKLNKLIKLYPSIKIDIIYGNLASPDDCIIAARDAAVVFHVAAGIEKTFPGCFMNSAVTTRNLLEACSHDRSLKRFVNVSSLTVYSNMQIKRGAILDENSPIETQFMKRNDAYCFGKAKQDEIVAEYGAKYKIPYVIVRPGVIYGPHARAAIHSRVGIGTFGIFLHIGGSNRIPLSYIDNCADAIVLAGLKNGINGQVFNIVDDNLPSSRRFLNMYKKYVRHFRSIYVPYQLFYAFCFLWERYSVWSKGQLPLAFNRRKCAAEWKGNQYSNDKVKTFLGWRPAISTTEGLKRHFEYFRDLKVAHD